MSTVTHRVGPGRTAGTHDKTGAHAEATGLDARPPANGGGGPVDQVAMTHREILEALSGLLMALFVGMLSTTIVANALPRITSDLKGTESQYTWVVTASLLAATAATPIWGKLADLFSKKLLMQLSIVVFVIGSALCGLSTSMAMLIGFRIVQGIGMGGLQALTQTVMGAMIPPRERGRYSGYLGAVMAVATVGGPLLGGVIVDTSWLGWRWCFYVGVPIAVVALIVLQRTLHLPTLKRDVSIDWLGATLITLGVSLLLVWVSFAGSQFDWMSWQTGAMVTGGVVSLLLAVFVESRVREPIIPLPIIRDRTTALSIVASIAVGMAMFGASVFFGQYFQIALGWSPTKAGLATIPMIGGLLIASTVSGAIISRYGRWKAFLVAGSVLLVAGLGLLGTIDHTTDYRLLAAFMALVGLGLGLTMQNLVLAVQNTVDLRDMGVASSVVTFFRSLGGAIGVSVLGAVAATQITDKVTSGLRTMGIDAPAGGSESLNLDALPGSIQTMFRAVYGDVIGNVFVIAAVVSVVVVLAVVFIKEVPLRMSNSLVAEAPPAAPAVEGPAAPATPEGTGRPVLGRVLRGDGQPLAGASVTLADVSGNQVDRTRTAEDGGYRLESRSGGTFLLIASGPRLVANAAMITIAEAPVHRDLVLAGTSVLRGHVRVRNGAGIAGALVTLTGVQGEVVASTVTGPEGGFALPDLLAGTYTLVGQATGHQPLASTVDIAAGGTVERDILLVGGGRVAGTVRAGSDGRPLPDAGVTLLDESGNVLAARQTGPNGDYAFDDLTDGTYTLIASGYAPVAAGLRVTSGVEVEHHVVLGTRS
ncbi:MAG: transporter [Cryptosporangiaceae bacterium]|nr:transporter [Cryptosporangiaceae bacterium]